MFKENFDKIILGTGNYENVKKGNTVSITGDGGIAWGYHGKSYKKLAPRLVTYNSYNEKMQELLKIKEDATKVKEYLKFKKSIEDEYIKSYYETRLINLDIEELLYELEDRFGDNIILLCHEGISEFCHRRILADYIELETGIYIPEISVNDNDEVKKYNPIRYKKRLLDVINNY